MAPERQTVLIWTVETSWTTNALEYARARGFVLTESQLQRGISAICRSITDAGPPHRSARGDELKTNVLRGAARHSGAAFLAIALKNLGVVLDLHFFKEKISHKPPEARVFEPQFSQALLTFALGRGHRDAVLMGKPDSGGTGMHHFRLLFAPTVKGHHANAQRPRDLFLRSPVSLQALCFFQLCRNFGSGMPLPSSHSFLVPMLLRF